MSSRCSTKAPSPSSSSAKAGYLTIPVGELLSQCRSAFGSKKATSEFSVPEVNQKKPDTKTTTVGASAENSYFCSLENFESAVVYLSQELQALGLGHLNLTTTSANKWGCTGGNYDALATAFLGGSHRGTLVHLDLICLVNRCWEVIQLYRASVRDSSAIQEQQLKVASTNSKLQATVSSLQDIRQDCDRKVKEANERCRRVMAENSQLQTSAQKRMEELRHSESLLKQHDTQFQHELRRVELQSQALKQRLAQLLAAGGSSAVVERRLEQSAPIVPTAGGGAWDVERVGRPKWSTVATEEQRCSVDVYRRVLGQYECWLAELSSEKESLYKSFEGVCSSLNVLVKKHAKVVSPEDLAASLTESVYSTDSLDEVLGAASSVDVSPNAGGIEILRKMANDSLAALTVMLAEKISKDTRVKRISELASAFHLHAPKGVASEAPAAAQGLPISRVIPPTSSKLELPSGETCNTDCPEAMVNDKNHSAGTEERSSSAISKAFAAPDSAVHQFVHLGVLGLSNQPMTEASLVSPPASPKTSTPDLLANSHSMLGEPNTLKVNASEQLSGQTCNPDLHVADKVSHDEHNTSHDAEEPSWLLRAGGPDDSSTTEVVTLKQLLEEERKAVAEERERYSAAALRLNKERMAFEHEKVALLRQQFLDEVSDQLLQGRDGLRSDSFEASMCRSTRVPAWVNEHHNRFFTPPPEASPHSLSPALSEQPLGCSSTNDNVLAAPSSHLARPLQALRLLAAMPNITPPPPAECEELRRGRAVVLKCCSKPASRRSSGGSREPIRRVQLSSLNRPALRQQRVSPVHRTGNYKSEPSSRSSSIARTSGEGLSPLYNSHLRTTRSRLSASPVSCSKSYRLPDSPAGSRTSSGTRDSGVGSYVDPPEKFHFGANSRGKKSFYVDGSYCDSRTCTSRESSVSKSSDRNSLGNKSPKIINNDSKQSGRERTKFSTLPKCSKPSRLSDPLLLKNATDGDDKRMSFGDMYTSGFNSMFSSNLSSCSSNKSMNLITEDRDWLCPLDKTQTSIVTRVTSRELMQQSRQGAETPPGRYSVGFKSHVNKDWVFPESDSNKSANDLTTNNPSKQRGFSTQSLPRDFGKHAQVVSRFIENDNDGLHLHNIKDQAKTLDTPISSKTLAFHLGNNEIHRNQLKYYLRNDDFRKNSRLNFDSEQEYSAKSQHALKLTTGSEHSSYNSRPEDALLNQMFGSLSPQAITRSISNAAEVNLNAMGMSEELKEEHKDLFDKNYINIRKDGYKNDILNTEESYSNSGSVMTKSDDDLPESASQVESQNSNTNARINAIETSLMKLIDHISGSQTTSEFRKSFSGKLMDSTYDERIIPTGSHQKTAEDSLRGNSESVDICKAYRKSFPTSSNIASSLNPRSLLPNNATCHPSADQWNNTEFRTINSTENKISAQHLPPGILKTDCTLNSSDMVSSVSSRHRNINHYRQDTINDSQDYEHLKNITARDRRSIKLAVSSDRSLDRVSSSKFCNKVSSDVFLRPVLPTIKRQEK